jgi:putative transposase
MRAHKISLDPTNKQQTQLAKSAGVARFAYNWALSEWQNQYFEYKAGNIAYAPHKYALQRQLNSVKHDQFPWMSEVTKFAAMEPIINLGRAFDNFFKGKAKYPKFKHRGTNDSFRITAGNFAVKGNKIRLPRIGWVRMNEEFRYPNAKLLSATVSKTAGKWFVSINVDEENITFDPVPNNTLGVDIGVREYVCSDGVRYEVPRSFRNKQAKLKRAQQSLARKQKGSKNRAKQKLKVAKIHHNIANIRKDWLHKTTTDIANRANTVVIEDLNVKGMVKNHHLALSISDAAFGEFRRQLTYKTTDRNSQLIVADRFYPSSKTCSSCGTKTKSLTLNIRQWTCVVCGTGHDRDLNAAKNLALLASNNKALNNKALNAGSSSVSVCGEFSASDDLEMNTSSKDVISESLSILDEAEIRQQLDIPVSVGS